MGKKDEIEEKIDSYEKSRLILDNIIDGGKKKRFIFTELEERTLTFLREVIDANMKLISE